MKTSKLFFALALVTTVFSSLQAEARKKQSDPNLDESPVEMVSLHTGTQATRLAERMIARSDINLYRGQTTTIATVNGEGVTYTPASSDLRKLKAFSQESLMYLTQNGQCDFYDSACIVYHDKDDSARRMATLRNQDGTVSVLIARMENFSSAPLREMIRTMDRRTKPKTVIFTRANGANY